jgi:LysM repeat protein
MIPAPVAKAPAGDATKPGATKTDEPGTHTVKSGETLGKIAKANKTTVKAIRDLNKLKTDQIKVGQKLKLPAAGETPATPPAR